MSKERLEEIEAKYSTLTASSERDGTEYTEVDVEDLVFLIQNGFKQAERVQELENVNRVLKKSSEGSEIAKERLRNWIDELEIENEHYREALEFYADEETYEPSEVQVGAVTKEGYKILKYKYNPIINTDKGKKARKALEGEK